ncbi:I78 family peptidase inhibitor [Halomonas sp. WWR20]
MIRYLLPVLLGAGLLSACQSRMPPEAPPSPPRVAAATPDTSGIDTTCGAEAVQSAVGRALDEALRERLASESGAARVRTMRPGQAYTMDYREDRLSVRVDAQGRIESLSCG